MDEKINDDSGKRNQSWTSRKMDWIDAANASLTGPSFKVAVCIMQHVNEDSGQAWPTRKAIAARTGLKIDTIKRAIGDVVRKGWFDRRIIMKDGKRYNIFTVRWPNVQAVFDRITEERIAENVVEFSRKRRTP